MIVRTGYEPRKLQAEIHRNLERFSVLVCHRRFGKTVLCINELIDQALRNQQVRPRYAYIAPLYRQAKQTAWDYLKAFTRPIPGVQHFESELRVELPGDRRIQLFGADNPDALRGIYLDGVVLDEYAQMPPSLWTQVIRPALSDRQGWAVFIGTPMGKNAFYALYERAPKEDGWCAAMYRASETGVIDADELAAAARDMSEDEYEQEFECSFSAAIRGAYYAKRILEADQDNRIGGVPWEPNAEVYTAWDLGIGDPTSIWFCQMVGREVRMIDYYEASGVGLDHYAKIVKEKPYVYADHIVPHDAANRSLSTGRTRVETLGELGLRVRVLGQNKVDDGINAVRNLLPRCWFDARKCERGLEALRQYRSEWDEKMQVLRPRPLHDWTSHAADSFRYLAAGLPDDVNYGDDDHDDYEEQGRSMIGGY